MSSISHPSSHSAMSQFEERADSLSKLLASKLSRKGVNLATISLVSPVLVLFLRHSGCTFCREALADLSASRKSIEASGATIVIVHPGGAGEFEPLLERNGLADLDRIDDHDQTLYQAFGLRRGSWWQLAGPRVLWNGIRAGLFNGHGAGRPTGDVKQMPGLFLLDRCEVVRSFRHRSASDRPLYDAFVRAGLSTAARRAQ